MDAITDRILAQLGDRDLIEKLLALSNPDFHSLLLKLFQERARDVTPADLLKAFQTNRFAAPGEVDPAAYHLLEVELLALAREMEIAPVLLSPAAPFASCSAFGCVDQNNVVSAARGTEILSDPTNMLAVIIAAELKNHKADNKSPLHYCATGRVLRGQKFPQGKGVYPHFGLFCIVSSGRGGGSYTCEKDLLMRHLAYYKKLLIERYNARLSVVLRKRGGYADGDGFFDRMTELVRSELPDVPISFDLTHEDNHYYKGINFKLYMEKEDGKTEIGDGGFVDWIQRMTGNRKERCLISGIGIDRLLI